MGRIDDELLNYNSKYIKNGVLINNLDIDNQEELDKAERMITGYKLTKMCLTENSVSFKVNDYLQIHKDLFENIYPFAGKIRDEVIAKKITFCLPQNIYSALNDTLKKAKIYSRGISTSDELLKNIVEIYSDLDTIHPFREGNGRTEREFIRRYMEYVCKLNDLPSYRLNYSKIENREEYINAVVKADAYLDYTDLYILFQSILEVKEDNKKLQYKSTSL